MAEQTQILSLTAGFIFIKPADKTQNYISSANYKTSKVGGTRKNKISLEFSEKLNSLATICGYQSFFHFFNLKQQIIIKTLH